MSTLLRACWILFKACLSLLTVGLVAIILFFSWREDGRLSAPLGIVVVILLGVAAAPWRFFRSAVAGAAQTWIIAGCGALAAAAFAWLAYDAFSGTFVEDDCRSSGRGRLVLEFFCRGLNDLHRIGGDTSVGALWIVLALVTTYWTFHFVRRASDDSKPAIGS